MIVYFDERYCAAVNDELTGRRGRRKAIEQRQEQAGRFPKQACA
jgi:hypothetical protein